jgi:hypothetical protein
MKKVSWVMVSAFIVSLVAQGLVCASGAITEEQAAKEKESYHS